MTEEIEMKKRKEQIYFYKEQVDYKIQNKETRGIRTFLKERMDCIKYDNDLMVVWYLGMVAEKELKAGKKSVFEKVNSLKELLERYRGLKFYVRRIEYDILDNAQEFYFFLAKQNVSEYELMGIVDSCVYNKDKVWKFFE